MLLSRQTTRQREVALWTLCLITALLLSSPLIAWSVGAAQVRSQAPAGGEEIALPLSGDAPSLQLNAPQRISGRAYLDLNALAQTYSVDDVDNIRWSLIRRTPDAARVYSQETRVDWAALRQITQSGTILMPVGFAWSFNETFQQGPGYKEAEGVLAGGHCALATVFRAAAVQAGLPAVSHPHARPFPGFPLEETVTILWGRDDLIVRNTTGQDLHFIWTVTSDRVEIAIAPVAQSTLPPLPDWRDATVTMVYGRPGTGGWGSLSQAAIADHALYLARAYAGRVDEWNGAKPVVVAINPNVAMAGQVTDQDLYLYYLTAEARRQGIYVMFDVQSGSREPLSIFEALMDKFLQENVWFDWDIEHTAGGPVAAEQINQVAAAYFARRQAAGYQRPGIFGFYVFKDGQVTNPADVRRQYDEGVVVPLFDGFGGRSSNPASDKIAKTAHVLSLFGDGPFGIMEFETRWGTRYDQINARDYFEAYSNALIVASQ